MKKVLFLIFVIFIFYLAISNTNIFFSQVIDSLNIWLYKVFPQVFTFYILGSLLVSTNAISIIMYIFKPFRKMFKFESDSAFNMFFLSIFLGNPATSTFIVSFLENKKITEKDSDDLLYCASFINPLFIISLFSENISLGVTFYLIHIFANFIICFFVTRKNKIIKRNYINDSSDFFESLNRLIHVLLIIALYMALCSIVIYSLSYIGISKYILSFLELSTGCVFLSKNINSLFNNLLIISLISFNGLCIHLQVYSSIKGKANYSKFLSGRLLQSFLSIIIFLIIFVIKTP